MTDVQDLEKALNAGASRVTSVAIDGDRVDVEMEVEPGLPLALNVADISKEMAPFVSPAKWDALPKHENTVLMLDADGNVAKRIKDPETLMGERYADGTTYPLHALCVQSIAFCVYSWDVQPKHYAAFGKKIDALLEVGHIFAKMTMVSVPLGMDERGRGRTALMALIFSKLTREELNAFLGVEAAIVDGEMPGWTDEDDDAK